MKSQEYEEAQIRLANSPFEKGQTEKNKKRRVEARFEIFKKLSRKFLILHGFILYKKPVPSVNIVTKRGASESEGLAFI